MNPETFKKAMPESTERLRGNFDRIYFITQCQLKYPNLMNEKLDFKPLLDYEPSMILNNDFREILTYVAIVTSMDKVFATAPY